MSNSHSNPSPSKGATNSRILHVEDLRKSFRTRHGKVDALRGVSFEVHKGEIFGLLGPNGSGKSTTINIIANLLEADSGRVQLLGKMPGERDYATGASFVTGDSQFLWTETGEHILEFYRRVYGAPRELVTRLIERFDLTERCNREWPQYSNGEKMRVRLIRALLARPRLLLLDEPTVGLDPDAALAFREVMKELRDAGTTIVLTSHYMPDVEALADRVCFIHHGLVKAIGAPTDFRAPKEMVEIEYEKPPATDGSNPEYINESTIRVPLGELEQALQYGTVRRLLTQEENLEDYFVNLAREKRV